MTANRPNANDDDHRVVPFRPRSNSRPSGWPPQAQRSTSPVKGLAKYEGGEREDDYRHRMMVNLAGLAVTVLLALAGIWLTIQIADLRKTQDCMLSGRRNCAPIDLKSSER
jgi:hypothetical protein